MLVHEFETNVSPFTPIIDPKRKEEKMVGRKEGRKSVSFSKETLRAVFLNDHSYPVYFHSNCFVVIIVR